MSKHEKLLQRLVSLPTDFTWAELHKLMTALSFRLEKAGGSGRKFVKPETGATLFIHQPHPGSILKRYQIKDAVDLLKKEGVL